jgi:hypothetical protein
MAGKAYIAPSILLQVIPVMELRAIDILLARLDKDALILSFSCLYNSNDSSPSTGGLTINPVVICPIVLLHNEIEASFNISFFVVTEKPSNSKNPPLNPHSPKNPFEVL